MPNHESHYFKWREKVRLNPNVSKTIYFIQSLKHSNFGHFRKQVALRARESRDAAGVALCCRIRDEAPFLREFVEYYLAAGVNHFFFYEKLSQDNYREILAPYVVAGLVTLFDNWPKIPVSPSAEEDCILRSIGRFEWIGFIDADEFVVMRDNQSIGEFLSHFNDRPAVALHWQMYGSNGHKLRPNAAVIAAYTRRQAIPDFHVKCFVRPESVSRYRNPHSWYYRGMRLAVTEIGRRIAGSISIPASAERAWINHYHHKSDQDYFEKASRKCVQDIVTMTFPNRTAERRTEGELSSNAVEDDCAVRYYIERCRALGTEPVLLSDCRFVNEMQRTAPQP